MIVPCPSRVEVPYTKGLLSIQHEDKGLTLKYSKAAIDKSNPPGPTPPISITVTSADFPSKVTVMVFPQTGELFPRPSPYCEGLRAVTNLDPSLSNQLEWNGVVNRSQGSLAASSGRPIGVVRRFSCV